MVISFAAPADLSCRDRLLGSLYAQKGSLCGCQTGGVCCELRWIWDCLLYGGGGRGDVRRMNLRGDRHRAERGVEMIRTCEIG